MKLFHFKNVDFKKAIKISIPENPSLVKELQKRSVLGHKLAVQQVCQHPTKVNIFTQTFAQN